MVRWRAGTGSDDTVTTYVYFQASMVQWIGRQPSKLHGVGSIPTRGTVGYARVTFRMGNGT